MSDMSKAQCTSSQLILQSLAAISTINCCPDNTPVNIVLSVTDDPVIARTIDANIMGSQLIIDNTNLKDGVYNFTLTHTFTNGDVQTDTGCTFLDKETKCKVAEYASLKEDNFEVQALYQALNYILDCSNCACSDACNIFSKLIKLLINDDCKCS